jgi:biotin transport system substrate-specific component
MQISEKTMSQSVVRTSVGAWSQTLWIVLFAAATAAAARVEIPHQPVPYTLQSMMVLLAGAFLGARNGAMSQMLYLVMGLLGAPVFALGGFGLVRLLGPTGGYLLAFPLAAAVVGYAVQRRRTLGWSFVAMTLGALVIFVGGTLQLRATLFGSWSDAFTAGFLIFSWWDVLKLSAASMIYHEVAKRWPQFS